MSHTWESGSRSWVYIFFFIFFFLPPPPPTHTHHTHTRARYPHRIYCFFPPHPFCAEVTLTLLAITRSRFIILTSPKKAEYFRMCASAFPDGLELTVLVKDKTDGYAANFTAVLDACKAGASGGKVKIGTFAKTVQEGAFANAWQSHVASDAVAAAFEIVDVGPGFQVATAIKDEYGQGLTKTASVLAAKVMSELKKDFMKLVDADEKVKHATVSEKFDAILNDPIAPLKLSGVSEEDFESCYPPTVQSGGDYDLSLGAESNEATNVQGDILIASLGARFRNYCSHTTRTFFINPTEHLERAYGVLHGVQSAIYTKLRGGDNGSDGVALRDVYAFALKYVQEAAPDLVPYFSKTCGFGIGIGLRDSTHIISKKSSRHAKENMTFCVHVAFNGVPMELKLNEKKKKKTGARALETFSIALGDTVHVGNHNQDAEPWTYRKCKSEWTKVSFDLSESGDESSDEDERESSSSSSSSAAGRGTRRSSRIDHEAMEAQKLKNEEAARKQANVLKKKQEKALREARARAAAGGMTDAGLTEEEKRVEAFDSSSKYPRNACTTPPKIYVDVDHFAVFFPVNGMSVPFHVACIKSCSVNDERTMSYIRVNFFAPNDTGSKAASPAIQNALEEHTNQIFVKELTYRSRDSRALNDTSRKIKQLIKEYRQSMREKEEKKDVVEQQALRIWPNDGSQGRRKVLKDISMRPKLGRGKRTNGALTMHLNGLRFQCDMTRDRVDITFNNIKHFIFQKCDKESHVVMIHVNLKHPILVNKKKCTDLSFYTEAVEQSTALNKSRRNMYDPDEMEEEQRERKMRRMLNKSMKNFCLEVHRYGGSLASSTFAVETPYAELAFKGTPNKEMVRLQPTINALVNVTENPPFIVTLDDIEHVHFEGVLANKRNFDMAIVMQDKTTWHRISAIPMHQLGSVREWLTDINQTCTHGSIAINWNKILSTVREIPIEEFWNDVDEEGVKKDVGWDFLNAEERPDSDASGEEDDGSEFEVGSEEEEEDEESDEWSGGEEESSDALDDEAYSDEDSSEAGEDWEEMERRASKEDKKRNRKEREREDRDRSKRPRRR